MRLQSTHSKADRGKEEYYSPPEATLSLLKIEPNLPRIIREPASGDGAIAKPLIEAGHQVIASDIAPDGFGQGGVDYLTSKPIRQIYGVVTNPPFTLAKRFIEKSTCECYYSAYLLRTNFLECIDRLPFFRSNPPARVWISSRRLPMMHRKGWIGKKSTSNVCYAWFIWDIRAKQKRVFDWFDWRELI